MSDVIENVVDAVDEMEYQAEVERNERELRQHSWINDPHKLAVMHADLMFGRTQKYDMVPVNWDDFKRMD